VVVCGAVLVGGQTMTAERKVVLDEGEALGMAG